MSVMSGRQFGRFDPTPRAVKLLHEVIDALRLVGILLAAGGIVVTSRIINLSDPITPRVAAVTGLVTVPGVLYLIGSIGLARRRYWAWVMSLSVTVLLIVAQLAVMIVIACTSRGGAQVFCPGFFCVLMPVLILAYMLRTLPVLRQAELVGMKGFMILPVARHAAADEVPRPEA
jgi:NADH:ubiquinone oxidoreductase subunit K